MKLIKALSLATLVLCLTLTLWLWLTNRAFIFDAIEKTYLSGFTTANINDHSAFKTMLIEAGETQAWKRAANYNKQALPAELKRYLEGDQAAALLVAHKGEIVSEHYFRGYNERSKTNSFSMAKSLVSILIGMAIADGYIDGWDQAATDFLPEFKSDSLGRSAKVKDFSTMTSGYDWTEHYYSAFSPTVQLYYGADVEGFLLNRNFSDAPGQVHYYSSASTQLLGIILKRALEQNGYTDGISGYLSEKLWQPLGMNDHALWHTDKNGMELVYCCLNTNARNYAKLGQLLLQNGVWRDQQLLPLDLTSRLTTAYAADYYGYSTWINQHHQPAYYWFSGHLGQYTIVVPDKQLLIVKLGETRNAESFKENDIPLLVKSAMQLIESAE